MKKLFVSPGSLLIVTLMVLVLVACQKDQNAVTAQTDATAATESTVVGVAGHGKFAGSIKPSYASALAYNFQRAYGSKTVSVAFSAKDLKAFISNLETKYKSDIIYVNFGKYGDGAPALNAKDNGRLTVFFTGNNMPGTTGGRSNNGVTAPADSDEFLNHGSMLP